jgi:hypothetical protein
MKRKKEEPKSFRIKKPDQFVNGARAGICAAFNDDYLQIAFKKNHSGNIACFYPVAGSNPINMYGNNLYLLTRDKTGLLYYSDYEAKFAYDPIKGKDGEYEFQSVSMRVWSGQTTDDMKRLLRAEWDPYIIGDYPHAQPHWQLDELVMDPSSPYKSLMHRFHFAMSSNWSEDEKCQQPVNSHRILTKWMKNCLLYVKSQIKLLG